eukprot:513949-Alexandrium_andersonii.AAC.1
MTVAGVARPEAVLSSIFGDFSFWVSVTARTKGEASRCPKCNPQSAQGPSVPQSASIRNPPC